MSSIINSTSLSNTAIVTSNGINIIYSQLFNDIRFFDNLIEKRSLIFLIGNNDYVLILWYLTSIEFDHAVLLLPPSTNPEQLIELLKIYQPRYLILKALSPSENVVPDNFKPAIDINKTISSFSIDLSYYHVFKNNFQQPILNKSLNLLLSTSGSTGSAKLVRLSKSNLISNAFSISSYQSLNPNERAIAHLPLSYSYGLSVLNSHLYSGASVVLCNESLHTQGFWKYVENHNITSFSGVPFHFEMLLKLGFSRINFHNIYKMYLAGGALSLPLLQRLYKSCTDNTLDLTIMYGQTEASPRISYLPSHFLPEKLGSIGVAIPNGNIWLRDENNSLIKDNDIQGELIYEGPNVCLGYAFQGSDLARDDDLHGVLCTGDLAMRDNDGLYYITGRLSRFLKIFGNRISLDQIEYWLNTKGFTVVATGKDNLLQIYLVHDSLAILPNNDFQTNLKVKIAHFCNIHLSSVRVSLIDSIPRLSNGKVDYQCLMN